MSTCPRWPPPTHRVNGYEDTSFPALLRMRWELQPFCKFTMRPVRGRVPVPTILIIERAPLGETLAVAIFPEALRGMISVALG